MSMIADIVRNEATAGQVDAGFLRADGMPYLRFLSRLHDALLFDWYLEIGTCKGRSLYPSRSKTVAIDPFFRVDENAIGTKPQLFAFQSGADEVFESGFLKRNDIRIGFGFLDGMHLFEYLLRDFINAERNATAKSVLALHDCVPFDHAMTTRDLDNLPVGAWTGDVWKLIPILREYRPELKLTVLDCAPTGLVVVTGLSSQNTVLADNYDEIVRRYSDMTLKDFGVEKFFDLFTFESARVEARRGFPLFASAAIDGAQALKPEKVST